MKPYCYPRNPAYGKLDWVAREIILKLAECHWIFPGIKIDCDVIKEHLRVNEIFGPNFYLWFSRRRKLDGDLNGLSEFGVTHVIIPDIHLSLFTDPMSYSVYCGTSVEEYEKFRSMYNPIHCVTYVGNSTKSFPMRWSDSRPIEFSSCDPRIPGLGLLWQYKFADVLDYVATWLEDNVVKMLSAYPV